jgi:hypothetical protein
VDEDEDKEEEEEEEGEEDNAEADEEEEAEAVEEAKEEGGLTFVFLGGGPVLGDAADATASTEAATAGK